MAVNKVLCVSIAIYVGKSSWHLIEVPRWGDKTGSVYWYCFPGAVFAMCVLPVKTDDKACLDNGGFL